MDWSYSETLYVIFLICKFLLIAGAIIGVPVILWKLFEYLYNNLAWEWWIEDIKLFFNKKGKHRK